MMGKFASGYQAPPTSRLKHVAFYLGMVVAAFVVVWKCLLPGTVAGPTDAALSTAPVSPRERLKTGAEAFGDASAVPTSIQREGEPNSTVTLLANAGPDDVNGLPTRSIDAKRLGELTAALYSGSVDDQIEAINLFGRVGTPEQEAMIVEHARNSNADVAVRLAAVENIDWREHWDLVTQLIRSNTEVGQAMIYLAAEKELSPESVTALTDTLAAMFPASTDPSFQLAVLHFLIERHSDRFDSLAAQATIDRYSTTESQDFAQLLELRTKEQEFLNDAHRPSSY